jgi:hypothetical protein
MMLRWKTGLGKHSFIDSPPVAHPPRRLFARKRVDNTQTRIVARHCIEFFSIDNVFQDFSMSTAVKEERERSACRGDGAWPLGVQCPIRLP